MKRKAIFSWSGGKDGALAMREVLEKDELEIAALLVTVTEEYGRVCMHGVRTELVEAQAARLGLPLEKVLVPASSSNERYEDAMRKVLDKHAASGVSCVVFGDILLEDVRSYREERLAGIGMQGLFPLWGEDTSMLATEFVREGFRAVVTCVDGNALDGTFAGRIIDERFLSSLPPSVDPCGENGEYHSFVFDGPIFGEPIGFERGRVVVRDDRFHFCDLHPLS